jgi:NAD(P)-dependent dehydrogenase (short-subunit alcohol dehydrogenase family)
MMPQPGEVRAATTSLHGRTAIVTGAARGIGYAIAHRLAREGANVAIADIDGQGAADASARIGELTGQPTVAVTIDVTDADSVRQGLARAEEAVGVCDIAVVNAGILLIKQALDTSLGEFNKVQQVNLLGAFTTATAFARRLAELGKPGAIVMNASIAGVRAMHGNSAYSASKFGMIGLTQALALDLAPAGVRVNAVCPGQIDTQMMDSVLATHAAESGSTAHSERARLESRVPLGRLGTVEDVAEAVLFLASDMSRYITGQHLVVDGGWLLT